MDFDPNNPNVNTRDIIAEMPPEYGTFEYDGDLPHVQLPLGRTGFTIDSEHIPPVQLPLVALKAHNQYANGGGRPGGTGAPKVHMCDECAERADQYGGLGYLTTSDNIGDYNNPYECPHTYRTEGAAINGATAGRFAPRPWRVIIEVNGDGKRVIPEDGGDPNRTLTVQKRDRYHADSVAIDEQTLELPDSGHISGTVDGQQWEADVQTHGDSVTVEWRLLDGDGNVVTYTYRETDGKEYNSPNEKLGFNVAEEYSDENIVTEEMQITAQTYTDEKECGSRSFSRVWPAAEHIDVNELVLVPQVTGDDVPNSQSHLARIQNQLASAITMDQLRYVVARAADAADRNYGDGSDNSGGGGGGGGDGGDNGGGGNAGTDGHPATATRSH